MARSVTPWGSFTAAVQVQCAHEVAAVSFSSWHRRCCPPPDAEDKLRDIRSVTDAALSYLSADDLLTVLLGRLKEILNADTAAVLLLDGSGRQLIATAASGLEEEVRQGV